MSHVETLGQLADARAEIARLTADLERRDTKLEITTSRFQAAQADRNGISERYTNILDDISRTVGRRGGEAVGDAARRVVAELAAACAVPADVEAAIVAIEAWPEFFPVDRLRATIARAIAEARHAGYGDAIARAKVLSIGADAGNKNHVEDAILTYRNAVAEWEHEDPISGAGKDAERRQCDAYIALLAAIAEAGQPATVGGQETPPVARPIDEWHEDEGAALWWRFPIDEPPYSGSPLDDDWPGYHTHWTAIVCPVDPAAARGPRPKGG